MASITNNVAPRSAASTARSAADTDFGCPSPSPTPRLAVLGVFSHEATHALRQASRKTWMRADADILAKFVMRRRGALPATLDEAKTHRDVVLVDAPASLPSKTAPLTTLLLWLECAASAWPNAQLVGKADDDVWVRAPLVAAHLRGSLAALASRTRGAPPRLYWGMFETMHWDDAVLRPAQAFSYGFGRSEACRRMVAPPSYPWRSYYNWTNKGGVVIHVLPTRMSREPLVPSAAPWPSHRRHGATNGSADAFIGPYPFAKGPLYFLDARLAAQLAADRRLAHHARTALRSANDSNREPTWPWEDIYTGLALANLATGAGLAAVHIGSSAFLESFSNPNRGDGLVMRRSALLWHDRAKKAPHIVKADAWAAARPCAAADGAGEKRGAVSLSCRDTYRSCSGARWLQCAAAWRNETACAAEPLYDLARYDERTDAFGGVEFHAPRRPAAPSKPVSRTRAGAGGKIV